jgi:soluble lytic murein transglycosylase
MKRPAGHDAGDGRSVPDKEAVAILSSMQKKALILSVFGVSVGAIAAAGMDLKPGQIAKLLPVAAQGVVLPEPPAYVPAAVAPPYNVSPAVSAALATWKALRQTDNNSFSTYASFLLVHRGWPGEAGLRKSAEKAIRTDSSSPAQVISFFNALPAQTAVGEARYAWALQALGRTGEAAEAARTAWTMGTMPAEDEGRLLTQFPGLFGPPDHDARIDRLLADRDRAGAVRMLPLASPERRPLFEARLALQSRASDAGTRLSALPAGSESDPGLLQDKASWLRGGGQASAARMLFAQRPRLTRQPANPEAWLETMLTLAREAANDRQYGTAYDIASKVDDVFPAGTDITARTAGERDDYTSLVWLAGTTAYYQLGRPAEATTMFARYARAGRSLQVLTKGLYWAGRAAERAGQPAASYFEEAARYPELFYAQLALERLGRDVPPPASAAAAGTDAFGRRSIVEATRLLGQLGAWQDQSLFIRALSELPETDSERAQAAALGNEIGRRDLGVWIARSARNAGSTFYVRTSYPEVAVPAGQSAYWSMAHGIIRQESSFDRAATSPVGARGMMQIMPPTAREIAGKLGVGYDQARLTQDPNYNIMLGSRHLAELMDYWGGDAMLVAAAYNAGSGNVRKWVRERGDPRLPGADVLRWIEEIPFTETRGYVQRVLENAVVYDAMNPGRSAGPARNRLSYYLRKGSPG